MKFVKIGVVILALVACVVIGYGIHKDNIEQEAWAKKVEAINKQTAEEKQKKEDHIQTIKVSLPQIACWGDSLTAGAGGNGVKYSNVLANSLNIQVLNYGVGGEATKQIAYRQGALPIYVLPTTIPSDLTPVEVTIVADDGNEAGLLKQGGAGLNPCIINEVKGNLSYDMQSNKTYFTRLKSGNKVELTSNTKIITDGMINKKDNQILIIYSGTNDHPDVNGIKNVIEMQRKMIKYSGTDKFIIVSLTSKDAVPDIENVNLTLKKEYGDKFLDIRTYLLKNGLSDAKLKATDQDILDIKNGEIPTSLRVDPTHGNEYYYNILGQQLRNKIIELKYLSDDQLEVLGVTK